MMEGVKNHDNGQSQLGLINLMELLIGIYGANN